MASSVEDNTSILLRKYSFKVVPDLASEDFSCNKCRMLIKDVYQVYCGCTYCRECIYSHLSEGKHYCNGNKGDCKKEPLILEGNVTRNVFLNNKILNVKVICPNESCSFSGNLMHMENHLRGCTKQAIECPYGGIGCSDERLTTDTIENHIQIKNIEHAQLLMDWVDQFRNESKSEMELLKRNLQSLREEHAREMASLKDDSVNKERQIEAQRREIESLKIRERDTLSKIDDLSFTIDSIKERTNMNGETMFTIDRINDRINIVEEVMLSPYFYSHNNGYKVRLRVHPGGYGGGGSGTHLSAGIKICKGEYDYLLPWPCKYSFHISVINQRSGGTYNAETLSHDTVPDNLKCEYDRPMMEDNIGYVYYKFISHTNLRIIDGLVINNRLIIKCIATPP